MGSNERKSAHRKKEYLILGVFLTVVFIGAIILQNMFLSGSKLRAHFETADGETTTAKGTEITLRIASTPTQRQKGLMFERNLGESEGMLFIFGEERDHSFWMKNTPLPLDIIFINSKKEVVGIVESATPFSTESVTVSKPSIYVVEVNAGRAKALKAEVGSKIVFHGPIPKGAKDTSVPKQ